MSSTYAFPGGTDAECQALEKPSELERFERAWAKRPWTEDESDKDRAWRWWQAALAVSAEEMRPKLPGHDETMAGLASLTIRQGER